MFKKLANFAIAPVGAITSGAVNQLSNFGNMLTGNVSPSDFVGNSIKNVANAGYQAFGGTSSPFGGGKVGGFKGLKNTILGVYSQMAKQKQDQASQQRLEQSNQNPFSNYGGFQNPFNNYGGFSNMLTGQGNFAPGQQSSRFGQRNMSKERFGDTTGQGFAPQSWR